jgi:hypothetical protein
MPTILMRAFAGSALTIYALLSAGCSPSPQPSGSSSASVSFNPIGCDSPCTVTAPNGVIVIVRHLGDFHVTQSGVSILSTAFSVRIVDHTPDELTLPQSTVRIITRGQRTIYPSAGVSFNGTTCFAYSHGNLLLMPNDDFTYPAPLCFVLGVPGQPAESPADLLVGVGPTVFFKLK